MFLGAKVAPILVFAGVIGALLGAPGAALGELRSFECAGPALPAEQAQKLVAAVQESYGKLKSLEAQFLQDSYLAALDASEQSNGAVWFQKPGRMKWEYRAPEPQTFLVRDTTVWLYQPQSNQVMIDEFRKVLISDLPVAFLMGLGSLTNDFSVVRACPGGSGTVIELQPRGTAAGENVKGFSLLVDGAKTPVGAKVTDVGGNVTAIVLTGVRPNAPVAETAFQADFPRGTDINDQRQKKGA